MPLPEARSEPATSLADEEARVADASKPDRDDQEKRDANALMMSGVGIGVFGVVAAAIGGAVCPVCVVAAPALLGVGAFRRWRVRRATPRS